MSDPESYDDPFDHVPPDEATELDALARALRLARGFTLLFAICNRVDLRNRLIDALRARLAPLRIQSVSIGEPTDNLLDGLRGRIESAPDAVFLVDLENWLPAGDEAERSSFVLNLNATRNYFPRDIPCPLVFWVPQHILTTLARAAPDFCSVRSGLFYFCATPQVRERLADELTRPGWNGLAGLDLVEKRERIGTLEEMIREHEALPPDLRDPLAEMRLSNSLATLYQVLGRYEEAFPSFDRTLAIAELSLGPDHPDVAVALNNLALLLQDTGRLAEAEPLYRRALAIGERSLGPDHPDVAADLNNLALLLRATGRLAEAEPLMRRALAIGERSLGPDHPDVAAALNNLALLLQDTGRLAEAEPLMRRALEIDERSLGPDHPTVAIRLNNLALLLKATGRLAEAEPLMRRALEIDERSLGPDHPDVAIDLNNLASLLRATGRLAEAEPLMRRALEIRESRLGPDDPRVANILESYADLLRQMGRDREAEEMEGRAEAIRGREGVGLQEAHPSTGGVETQAETGDS